MKKQFNQTGRSMVEMLGVLAIIGVLSIGGIAGYSKAMEKFRHQKAFEQLQIILSNITQLDQGILKGMDNVTAIRAGIIPVEMLNGKSSTSASEIYNVFNKRVFINENGMEFGLPDIDSCVYFATANWGMSFGIGGYGDYCIGKKEIPLSPSKAQQICKEQILNDGGGYIELFFIGGCWE